MNTELFDQIKAVIDKKERLPHAAARPYHTAQNEGPTGAWFLNKAKQVLFSGMGFEVNTAAELMRLLNFYQDKSPEEVLNDYVLVCYISYKAKGKKMHRLGDRYYISDGQVKLENGDKEAIEEIFYHAMEEEAKAYFEVLVQTNRKNGQWIKLSNRITVSL